MKIWRLETESKVGVYQARICQLGQNPIELRQQYINNPAKHPTPKSDSLFVQNYKEKGMDYWDWAGRYYFGFTSPQQLLHWFYDYDDLIALEYAGIRLSIYESEDVIVGNTQVAFRFVHQDPIETMSICEFLDKFGNLTNADFHALP